MKINAYKTGVCKAKEEMDEELKNSLLNINMCDEIKGFTSIGQMKEYGTVNIIDNKRKFFEWYAETRKNNIGQRTVLYRGQADASWLMKTTLLRRVQEKQCDYQKCLDRFLPIVKDRIDQADYDCKPNDDQTIFFAQHYGVDTPFLDVTFDPLVALYFATRETGNVCHDSELKDYVSVIGFNVNSDFCNWKEYNNLEKSVVELLNDVRHPIWLADENKENERMTAQMGAFIYLTKNSECSADTVFKAFSRKSGKKIITYNLISRSILSCVKKLLGIMGINETSMRLGEGDYNKAGCNKTMSVCDECLGTRG